MEELGLGEISIKIIVSNAVKIAIVNSDAPIINDGQSAVNFGLSIVYEHDCRNIAVNKAAVSENFFKLSTGVAGEITQKFVNYRIRLAIIGDFSVYTSKPLHDFIYESNNGRHLYFAEDEDEAIDWLSN